MHLKIVSMQQQQNLDLQMEILQEFLKSSR